jgi:mono/diheme cytochrome c family protein
MSLALLTCLFGRASAQVESQSFDKIERGRYVAVLADCGGCHTEPGGQAYAGGLSIETPFGRLVTPNITPDVDTGIGGWTDSEFIAAIREGRGHNGTRLYPAMPYPTYSKISDQDVEALRAYFATIEPVRHEVISNQLPFPFNIRYSLLFWNWMNFKPTPFQPVNSKSAEWNRGAYIVQGPGHCGTCHTPKNVLGGDKTNQALQGTVLQGWFAPNITNDSRNGLGRWSKPDLVQYLKSGSNSWTLASGPMAEAVTHSTSQMTDDDLSAIASYLKDSAGPSVEPQIAAPDQRAMKEGAAIYKDNCAACHRDNGRGDAGLFPRLADSPLVQSSDPTTLIRLALDGSRAVATPKAITGPAMPSFDWRLNDGQIAAVLTYIRNSWTNRASSIESSAVKGARTSLAKSP